MGRAGIAPHTYEWIITGLPYIVVYEIHSDPDLIVILGIFHSAQNRSTR